MTHDTRVCTIVHSMLLILLLAAVSQLPCSKSQQLPSVTPDGAMFNCDGRPDGFYADMADSCRSYYRCVRQLQLFHFSCPAGTRFSQLLLVCDHERHVNCSESPLFFGRSVQLLAALRAGSVSSSSNDLRSSATQKTTKQKSRADFSSRARSLLSNFVELTANNDQRKTAGKSGALFFNNAPKTELPTTQLKAQGVKKLFSQSTPFGRIGQLAPLAENRNKMAELQSNAAAKLLAVSLGSLQGFHLVDGDKRKSFPAAAVAAAVGKHDTQSKHVSDEVRFMNRGLRRRFGPRQDSPVSHASPQSGDSGILPFTSAASSLSANTALPPPPQPPPLASVNENWRLTGPSAASLPPEVVPQPPQADSAADLTRSETGFMSERTRQLSGAAHSASGVFFSPLLWLANSADYILPTANLPHTSDPHTSFPNWTGTNTSSHFSSKSTHRKPTHSGSTDSIFSHILARRRHSDIDSDAPKLRETDKDRCSHCLAALVSDWSNCLPCVRPF